MNTGAWRNESRFSVVRRSNRRLLSAALVRTVHNVEPIFMTNSFAGPSGNLLRSTSDARAMARARSCSPYCTASCGRNRLKPAAIELVEALRDLEQTLGYTQ